MIFSSSKIFKMQILDDDIGRVPQNGQSLEVSKKWFSLLADAVNLLFWATLLLLVLSIRNRIRPFLSDDFLVGLFTLLPMLTEAAAAYFLFYAKKNLREGVNFDHRRRLDFGIQSLRNALLALFASTILYIFFNLRFLIGAEF